MRPSEPADERDWELAKRAVQGDESAYAALIERYQAPIHSFVFRSVGDTETARDVTQEVFVKAWFALARVRESAQFSTWLFQIAVNLCRDHAKSKATRKARHTEPLARRRLDDGYEDREFASPDPSPAQSAETREAVDALEAEIQSLPEELRFPLILGVIEKQPYKEVATSLGLSAKAVEVRIYRARRVLAERLRRLGFHVGDA